MVDTVSAGSSIQCSSMVDTVSAGSRIQCSSMVDTVSAGSRIMDLVTITTWDLFFVFVFCFAFGNVNKEPNCG